MIKEKDGRFTCTDCGHVYSSMLGDDEIPETCHKCKKGVDFLDSNDYYINIFNQPKEINMANYCFTDVPEEDNKFRVAKIVENESGYYPLGKANPNDPHEIDKYVGDENHVRAVVDTMNKHLGVDKDREWEIKFSTMHVINGGANG